MHKLLIYYVVFLYHLSQALFCPPVTPPCFCSSSIYEPINIKCSGATSLAQVISSLDAAKNALKIDYLLINATPANILPPKIFQNLNIQRLSLRKMGLSDLDPMAFDSQLLETITELDLSENNFTKTPFHAVSALKNLKKLNLSKNRLSYLSADSFVSFESKEKLISLDLSNNKIQTIDPMVLGPLKNLEEINLQGNQLMTIPVEALRNVKFTLKNLNLALNKISKIEACSFDFPKLESLSLEYNDLTEISPESLYGLHNLLYLYLTGNKLLRWESELFRAIVNLRNLGIGGTAITHIPWNAFIHSPHLLRLEMSDGVVNTVDCRAFRGAKQLQAIILNNNKLTEIKEDTFHGLTDLYTLDLSRNNIHKIADKSFAFLPGLRHLDLTGNELQSLEQHTFDGTFQAPKDSKMLYLCRNPWTCDEKMDEFRKWLRDHIELVIDKPDCTSVCRTPDWLTNWPIRFPNPPPPSEVHLKYVQQRHNGAELVNTNVNVISFRPWESKMNTVEFRPPYVFSTVSSATGPLFNATLNPYNTSASLFSSTVAVDKATIPLYHSTMPFPYAKLFQPTATVPPTIPVTVLPPIPLAPYPPFFEPLQGNPSANRPIKTVFPLLLDPTQNVPSFTQFLFGKITRPMMHVLRSSPNRSWKEYESPIGNNYE